MTQKIYYSVITLLLMTFGTFTAQASDYGETKEVATFNSIEITTVGTVYFRQSNNYSLFIKGNKDFVKQHTCKVENGKLILSCKNDNYHHEDSKDTEIYITAPDLKQIDYTGVGEFICNEPIELKNIDIDVEGVGKIFFKELKSNTIDIDISGVGNGDINIDCKHINASLEGVGRLKISGRTNTAHITKDGIGTINTKDLTITNN